MGNMTNRKKTPKTTFYEPTPKIKKAMSKKGYDVLSFMLWLLVLDVLPWLLEDITVFAQAFADLLGIIIIGKFANIVCDCWLHSTRFLQVTHTVGASVTDSCI